MKDNMPGNKSKKMLNAIKAVIIMLVLLLIAILGLTFYMSTLQEGEFKVYINGQRSRTLEKTAFIVGEDNSIKVNIKTIGPSLGEYTYYNGTYKGYTEDKSSCYLMSEQEVVEYTNKKNIIRKKVLTDENSDYQKMEEFQISEKVENINDELYTSLEGISIGFNARVTYDENTNIVNIETLPTMLANVLGKVPQAAIVDEDVDFNNQKAVLYGLVLVKDEKERYGINDTTNQVIIGQKYQSIKFIESLQQFLVKTQEGKMGIIQIEDGISKNIVAANYDNITEIDDELYLVQNNGKYGIINNKNEIIIPVECEAIGIDKAQVSQFGIDDRFFLYDTLIPIKKEKKWGLVDKTTKLEVIKTEYDELGCITNDTTSTGGSLLLIPEYNGIVVKKDQKYGVINTSNNVLLPIEAEKLYSQAQSNKIEYFFSFNNEEHNLISIFEKNNIHPVKTTGIETSTNTQNN